MKSDLLSPLIVPQFSSVSPRSLFRRIHTLEQLDRNFTLIFLATMERFVSMIYVCSIILLFLALFFSI